MLYIRHLLLVAVLQAVLVLANHGHGHAHGAFHKRAVAGHVGPKHSNSSFVSINGTLGDATAIVQKALAAAALRNQARVENPKFNKHDINLDSTTPSLAAPLEFIGTNLTKRSNVSISGNIEALAAAYSIQKELVDAARILAEATDQTPEGDHELVAQQMRAKHGLGGNDTNVPIPHKTPEGLLGKWGLDAAANASEIGKRDGSYWMTTMEQLGSSPFAPAGYKVWRSVRDYGAKGDGKTDDTDAINRAIADGGRCGPNCGSSTIHPAVVYFPPGSYLISSSIIQYYNTQLLGDPNNIPTILGASSFVGLGMITSDVYISDEDQWYLNTNNFLRSIRNFVIDLRNTDTTAYICGIHWQVAQGTSIENVTFYMQYNGDVPGNTQQGIYMENGSGGFLADLIFVGGNFGAYMGNQQFTTSHLVFVRCNTAVQIHWDWAWTMHDFIIESCQTGLTIVGGAGGPMSAGQGVGSLVLVDSKIANTPRGIVTTLASESSTSFLLQNVGFFNVKNAVEDQGKQNNVLLNGGNEVIVESWGFGRVNNATGPSKFVPGGPIPTFNRSAELVHGVGDKGMKSNFFTRRRPTYYNVPSNRIMNVKSLGAKGDGSTDDTAVLNAIFDGAANTSAIVYLPFGVYKITNTLRVPTGSRIIGQAWSQIMAAGSNFADEQNPRAAVQFGRRGDVGILEVQDIMVTVSAKDGATPGAVLVEWNIKQSSQGSAGMWDSHIRVGGAKGTGLQKEECPKHTGRVNDNCKAASLLMHLTQNSTAYLENVWLWTADHDMDKVTQDQIDIYAGRGLLVESDVAWLWGTSVEHCVFYQYQLSSAKNILMSMIQTESPYFQPSPKAPVPFKTGIFPNDPTFANCTTLGCYSSWAIRVVDSSSIYLLGAGLYSWFSDYSQDCVKTENCQQRGFEVVESYDIWVYNLCTKAIVEMVSPLRSAATMAADNKNGFLSSVVAWLQGAKESSGLRQFVGFQVYTSKDVDNLRPPVSLTCRTALTKRIECHEDVESFARLSLRSTIGNKTEADAVCDAGCGKSLDSWFQGVTNACGGFSTDDGAPLTLLGGYMYAGYNETCLMDKSGKDYCVDLISDFSVVSGIEGMTDKDICSDCFTGFRSLMQKSSYSLYDSDYMKDLDYINKRCGLSLNTTVPSSLFPETKKSVCAEDRVYMTKDGDTCDSIAIAKSVSSAAIYIGNPFTTPDCKSFKTGTKLCLPPSCAAVYTIKKDEMCIEIESAHYETLGTRYKDIVRYNPWIEPGCGNMWASAENSYGHVICLAPQNGKHTLPAVNPAGEVGKKSDGYARDLAEVPSGVSIADGTTRRCGLWHTAQKDDTCLLLTFGGPTSIEILMQVNPTLGKNAAECSSRLVAGTTYCVFPMFNWDYETGSQPPTTTASPSEPATVSSSTTSTTSSAPATPLPAFKLKSKYRINCDGAVHNDVTMPVNTDGFCIDTDCQVGALDIAAEGLCPDGQVQISYWQNPGCQGEWYGYGYASKGICRKLWTDGWKFKAVYLRCAAESNDCVSKGTCKFDPEPKNNVC